MIHLSSIWRSCSFERDHDGRLWWLYEWWKRVDEWIGASSG